MRSLVPVPDVSKQLTREHWEGKNQLCLLSHVSGRLSHLPVAVVGVQGLLM